VPFYISRTAFRIALDHPRIRTFKRFPWLNRRYT
jgi:hypothetical protein